jgi:ligand-binding sensor domain-containing protein
MISVTMNKVINIFGTYAYPFGLQLILLMLLLGKPGFSQEITFNKVFPPNRTDFNSVSDITQDKYGNMWFATGIGLYRYNGYEMISFKNNQLDPNSIADGVLRGICIDNEENIWIAIQGEGLDKFDPVSGKFTHYKSDPEEPGSVSSNWVNAMLVDRDGILWIGSGEGLDKYDPQTDKFIHYKNIPGDSTSLSYDEIVTIYEDRDGTLWIGTGSVYGADQNNFEIGGLNKMDKETGTFKQYKHNPEDQNSLINNKVSAIFEDSNGILWIGTAGDGLHTMEKSGELITRHPYDPNRPKKLSRPPIDPSSSNDHIRFIIEDVTGASMDWNIRCRTELL